MTKTARSFSQVGQVSETIGFSYAALGKMLLPVMSHIYTCGLVFDNGSRSAAFGSQVCLADVTDKDW